MKPRILFITGSDTNAGKTVLASLLTQYLYESGRHVAGLKPICSGNRADARALHQAAGKVLPLDEVNPWHFRAPLAPLLAARREQRRVRLPPVVSRIVRAARDFKLAVVEGAGGLLSPLGEGFSSRDLIVALDARPIVVCPNRLGAVNQAMLVLAALPRKFTSRAEVVLSDAQTDATCHSNLALLREMIGRRRVHHLPRLSDFSTVPPALHPMLDRLVA